MNFSPQQYAQPQHGVQIQIPAQLLEQIVAMRRPAQQPAQMQLQQLNVVSTADQLMQTVPALAPLAVDAANDGHAAYQMVFDQEGKMKAKSLVDKVLLLKQLLGQAPAALQEAGNLAGKGIGGLQQVQ